SDTPAGVVTDAGAFINGLRQAGVTPIIKHFPGHGHSDGDSHKGAVSTPPLAEMRKADLIPFVQLSPQVPAVMVGHLDVPDLTTPGRPASVSPEALELL